MPTESPTKVITDTLASNRALLWFAVLGLVAIPVLVWAKEFAKEWFITRVERIAEREDKKEERKEQREAEKEKRQAEIQERREVREFELKQKTLELEILRAKLELGRNDDDRNILTTNHGRRRTNTTYGRICRLA